MNIPGTLILHSNEYIPTIFIICETLTLYSMYDVYVDEDFSTWLRYYDKMSGPPDFSSHVSI